MELELIRAQFECPHRLELLKRLSELIGEVEPLIWASLWLSDLECLRKIVSQAEEAADTTHFSFDGIAAKHDFIRKCGL
jgi:hypothetical protein